MELTQQMIDQLKEDLSKARTYEDLMGTDGAVKKLMARALEAMLEAELTEHLGYEKHSLLGKNSGNSRNGKSKKTLKNENGEIEISVPRDRNSEFDPQIVKKYDKTIGPIEDKIISMYSKGMTTRDIQDHVEQLYGLDISPALVSNITNSIISIALEWQSRPLDSLYPIVFFDAIYYKVRYEGRVVTKAAYTCLAIDVNGKKDLLGLWVSEAEGANFWLSVITELRNRGVEDILIACVDGLKGFPEAINSVYPKTEVQLCIVHVLRNTLKYISKRDKREFARDIKAVYTAPSEEAALNELEKVKDKWVKKYPLAIKIWKDNWTNIASFFKYSPELRKIIYTTNTVESLHRQFRKVTKSKSIFPNDDALKKMLYLAYRDLSKKWTSSVWNWMSLLSQLSIIYDERLLKHLNNNKIE